jgi:hypothetical protein
MPTYFPNIAVSILAWFWSAPSPPILLTPTNGAIVQSNPPELVWHTDGNMMHFQLQVATSDDFSNSVVDVVVRYDNRYVDLPLLSLSTYYWRVRVQSNRGKWSQWSPVWTFSTTLGIVGHTLDCRPGDCSLIDTFMFAACGADVRAVNISDRQLPKVVRRYPCVGRKISRYNNTIFIVGAHDFAVADVSDPLNPIFQGRSRVKGFCYGVVADDNYCYSTHERQGLAVFDITDPMNPYHVRTIEIEHCYGLDKSGDYVLVASGGKGISIIEVSKRSELRKIGEYDTQDFAGDVSVYGNTALIADQHFVEIVDISQLPAIKRIYAFSREKYFARGTAIYDNIAYIITDRTIDVYDITVMTDPAYLGTVNIGSRCNHVVAADDIAYLSAGEKGLYVLQIRR